MINAVNNDSKKLVKSFYSAKTIDTIYQNMHYLDAAIDSLIKLSKFPMEEIAVMISGNENGNITSINGIDVPFDEDRGFVTYKGFRETIEFVREAYPDQIAVIGVDNIGDCYITSITIEAFNLDEKYPNGEIGVNVLLK